MTPNQRTAPLAQQQVQQWQDEGYLLLHDIIPQTNISGVRQAFERTIDGMIADLKAEGLIDDERKDLPLETRYAEVARPFVERHGRSWRKVVGQPEVFELQHNPQLVDIIGQLTGTDVIGHPVFNARPKLPHQEGTVVPWHQDSGYYGPNSNESLIITVWIPIVPVNAENGCMQIAPGSHRSGLLEHQQENRAGRFLEIAEVDNLVDEARAVTCPMEPSDVLLFHNLTFHRSLPNTSSITRWSIDIRYMRDGDCPGTIAWTDPDDKWIIRSATQPVTTLDQWMEMVAALGW
ncbi:MAG TPA: phytanoyl-CoA dioxygenase family protein [Abditibacteriaceae bacterium]|nr:phytanoyl-CoA dioxygenase family protein [Abditibacteriaceae bacterium]